MFVTPSCQNAPGAESSAILNIGGEVQCACATVDTLEKDATKVDTATRETLGKPNLVNVDKPTGDAVGGQGPFRLDHRRGEENGEGHLKQIAIESTLVF